VQSRSPRRPPPSVAVMSSTTGPFAQSSSSTSRPRRLSETGPSSRWRIVQVAAVMACEQVNGANGLYSKGSKRLEITHYRGCFTPIATSSSGFSLACPASRDGKKTSNISVARQEVGRRPRSEHLRSCVVLPLTQHAAAREPRCVSSLTRRQPPKQAARLAIPVCAKGTVRIEEASARQYGNLEPLRHPSDQRVVSYSAALDRRFWEPSRK
jgi:hypothetical protein